MYQAPYFLKKRYPLFEQRWDLRDQFAQILQRLGNHELNLQYICDNHKNHESAQMLLKEIKEFKVWSWKEADRDTFFYEKVKEFDKRAFRINTQLRTVFT